jgi:protein SCO1/2
LLNRRTLLLAGGALVLLVAAIHLLAAGIYGVYNLIYDIPAVQQPAASPTPVPTSHPGLQVAPQNDLQALQSTERSHLSGYIWLDRESGVVRIPIDRAMQLVAERGLPVATQAAPAPERLKADESGFPHPTLNIQGTPGPHGTPLLEITASQNGTAESTQTGATTDTPTAVTPAVAGFNQPTGQDHDNPPFGGSHLEVEQLSEVRFDQQLGNQLPLEANFMDETGQPISLRRLFGSSPVILVFADLDCPMLCPVILGDLANSLTGVKLSLGEQYQVITLSLDPADTPELAASRKAEILASAPLTREGQGWHFLTGEAASISKIAQATGFQYAYDQTLGQFAHPTGLVILSSQGIITRYIPGLEYSAQDLRLSLVEASAGKVGAPIDRLFLMCYEYDPVHGRYTLAINRLLRIAGLGTALALLAGVLILYRRERNGISLVPRTGLNSRRPG